MIVHSELNTYFKLSTKVRDISTINKKFKRTKKKYLENGAIETVRSLPHRQLVIRPCVYSFINVHIAWKDIGGLVIIFQKY